MKSIVLVGFMGAGKTAVGRELAAGLGWPLVDTDALIVQRAGMSINRIFAEQGEPAFRAMETAVLADLCRETAARVISTGGGIVTVADNWPRLRQLGPVVCLRAEAAVIWQRVGKNQDRPLLQGTPAEVQDKIRNLLAQRSSAYAQADWCEDTDHATPAQVAERILGRLDLKKAQH